MLKSFEKLKMQFEQDSFPSIKTRRGRLQSVRSLFEEYSSQLCEAISLDFGYRSHHETKLAEIFPILSQLKYTEDHLTLWLHEEHRPVEFFFQSASGKVIHVPLGVVGIITPWNFPLLLAFSPLITALAGGNMAMIKMSELTPRTAKVLIEAVKKHLGGCVCVFEGDLESNKAFAEIPFDHLFFTGSTQVGYLVMQAAAKNLTPVTLELGGKCPVFMAPDANVKKVAEKVNWGKSLNAGQVCLAPDYVVCPEDRLDTLIDLLKSAFLRSHPNGIHDSNYTSIINTKHYERLLSWLEEAKSSGATVIPLSSEATNSERKMIAPHLIINPPLHLKVMSEEIFGPLLPIVTYSDFRETKKYLKHCPNPLALYLFTEDKKIIEDFQHNTSSGGLCVNETVLHIAQEHLPFGGVRTSGIGYYHGIEGFLTFTRPKTVFVRGWFSFLKLAYPPYREKLLNIFYWLIGIKSK